MKKQFLALTLLSSVILGGATATLAEVTQTYETKGTVEFVEDNTTSPPVDPENPDPEKPVIPTQPVDPEIPEVIKPNPGPLSLNFASSLYFGKQKITNVTKEYEAAAQSYKNPSAADPEAINFTTNYVQVTDNRGAVDDTWTLSVKQEKQFETAGGHVLNNAEINFTEGNMNSLAESAAPSTVESAFALVPGEEQDVVTANAGEGAATWVFRFGKDETLKDVSEAKEKGEYTDKTEKINSEITLTVPGKTEKLKDVYTTDITWTLKDVPGETVQP